MQSFAFSLSIILFSLHAPTLFASRETFPYCSHTFSCGNLTNIYYPFFGGQRPDYCGLPGFQLTCLDNSTTVITINSLTYRVLELNQLSQTLLLTREDLFNTTCTNLFVNTTLNNTLFSFGSNNEVVTLFYGCDDSVIPETIKPENLFTCEINGKKDAYYLLGPVPRDPMLSQFQCSATISVPIQLGFVDVLGSNRSLLSNVLKEGFNASYINPFNEDCLKCYHSGGECGFNISSVHSLCICPDDRPCPGGKSKSAGLGVGLGIAGAVVVGICMGCWFLLIVQKRKRIAAQSQHKDIQPPTPLIKGQAIPISNFAQTILPYPSAKSDVEKGSMYFGTQVFSYDELVEVTNNFHPSKELGDGGFGTVYYGILSDGRVVAVKRLYENNIKRAEQFMNEVQILTRLRHKNLVTLYGCTSRRSRELLLVYEYIPNGTVADHLHGSKSGLLPWRVRLSIAIETADALAYLHNSDVIHRDVKTSNILLHNNFHVKVADFGLSRLFPNDVTHVSTAPQGTPGYVDPEYYQCYQLTDKSDVYSFGVVLVELISSLQAVDTNRHKLDINLSNMAVKKIQNHQLNELVDPSLGFESDNEVRKMITSVAVIAFRCLQQEKDMRPTMTEVLEGLNKIEYEHYGSKNVDPVDSREDNVRLLKQIP